MLSPERMGAPTRFHKGIIDLSGSGRKLDGAPKRSSPRSANLLPAAPDRLPFFDRFEDGDVADRVGGDLERILVEDHQIGELARLEGALRVLVYPRSTLRYFVSSSLVNLRPLGPSSGRQTRETAPFGWTECGIYRPRTFAAQPPLDAAPGGRIPPAAGPPAPPLVAYRGGKRFISTPHAHP